MLLKVASGFFGIELKFHIINICILYIYYKRLSMKKATLLSGFSNKPGDFLLFQGGHSVGEVTSEEARELMKRAS